MFITEYTHEIIYKKKCLEASTKQCCVNASIDMIIICRVQEYKCINFTGYLYIYVRLRREFYNIRCVIFTRH